jgi:DNA mismatch repair protein MutS2
MDEKTLTVLEFPRILEKLAGFTSFSLSNELALQVKPTTDISTAQLWQKQTSEGRNLLNTHPDISLGGAADIRHYVDLAGRGGVLAANELLDVKNTLICARILMRTLDHIENDYPALATIIFNPPEPFGIVDAISRCISERGDILDNASDQLAVIRRDMKLSHERLLSRLERYINDPHSSPMLQEGLITQRDGRYVLPLRSEFKGQLKSIVHDQSSSGATLFVEPLAVVELNNKYKELQLAERDEERRILAGLSTQVGAQAADIHTLLIMLAELDLVFARAKYADELSAVEPILFPIPNKPANAHPGSRIRLYNARHPLLNPASVVPIDLVLDEDTFILVITGPNTGGKTVTLKTVGLFALMSQSGLHIPAISGSEISVFKEIFADIGDEQSIEQSLSTFSGHITNIIHILKKANSHSLVLLDELGAGTDPQEGAALAMAILKDLLEGNITSMVATHYPELKTFAHNTPAVVNASLEFNLQTLRPTYHLSLGLPGRSNALSIAERLGLPAKIIEAARATIHPDELRAEDLLDEIYHQRGVAREERAHAESLRVKAEEMERQLTQRLKSIETERQEILATTRKETEKEMALFQREVDDLKKELLRARQPLDVVKAVQDQVDQMEDESLLPKDLPGLRQKSEERFHPGSKVFLESLNMNGTITSLTESEAEVLVGNLRIRARLSEIQRPDEQPEVEQPKRKSHKVEVETGAKAKEPARQSPGMELDIRGQRAEDGLDMLDRYIEQAYLTGLPFVRIIHGKGTGRLRQVIREALKENQHVKNFESGMENEGGDGVTVARLRSD